MPRWDRSTESNDLQIYQKGIKSTSAVSHEKVILEERQLSVCDSIMIFDHVREGRAGIKAQVEASPDPGLHPFHLLSTIFITLKWRHSSPRENFHFHLLSTIFHCLETIKDYFEKASQLSLSFSLSPPCHHFETIKDHIEKASQQSERKTWSPSRPL